MNNLINPLALSKVLNKYNLNPKNKMQLVLLSKRQSPTCSTLQILARKLEFKQTIVDKQEQQYL